MITLRTLRCGITLDYRGKPEVQSQCPHKRQVEGGDNRREGDVRMAAETGVISSEDGGRGRKPRNGEGH